MQRCIYYIAFVCLFRRVQFSYTYNLLSKCPDVTGKENFSEERFLGVWYLQQCSISNKNTCIKYNFINLTNNIYMNISSNLIRNESYEFKRYSQNMYIRICTKYTLKGIHRQDRINANQNLLFSGSAMYVVLDVDYDNYLLLWKCENFYLFTKSEYFVFTRARLPNKLILQQAYSSLTSGKIKKKLILYRIKQDNCTNND